MTEHRSRIVSGDDEVTGVWRDGDRLVVSRFECVFPVRCVKSNTGDDLVLVDFDSAKMGNAGLVKGFMVGTAIVGTAAGEVGASRSLAAASEKPPVVVSIPLSQTWVRRRKRSKVLSYACIAIGILGTLGFTIAFVMTMSNGFDAPGSSAVLLGFFAMLIVTAAGFVSLLFTNQEPLQLHRQTDHCFWLKGASKGYLETLPELTMDSLN